jgi:hypothetical protein
MLIIAGGVILGGIGLLLFFAVLPWIFAVLQVTLRIAVNLSKLVGRGLAFVIEHPLRALVGLVTLVNPLIFIVHLVAKERAAEAVSPKS